MPYPLRWLCILGSVLFAAPGCKDRDAPPAEHRTTSAFSAIFALDAIPEIRLSLADEAIAELKKKPKKFARGSISFDGQSYQDVGIRVKGHRSLRAIDDKPSFKLRLDKYVAGQSIAGYRNLTLNNMVEDPTMLREILAYRVMRIMGVRAPDIGYVWVFVNERPYGLYTLVETIDERFVSQHFDDGTGNLYEGEYGCDLFVDDVDGFDLDAGTDLGRADLRAFATAVHERPEQLFDPARSPLHMESFLGYLAASAFIGDFDGYRHSHNYRIYHEPKSDLWYFIPWGLDRVFKKSLSIYDSQGLLAKRCFADAGCRLRYIRTLATLIDRFQELHLDRGVHVIGTLIDKHVREDTNRPYDSAKTLESRRQLLDFIARRPDEIRAELTCIDEQGAELDADGDGHGCTDCNDADPAIHPGASEVCDGLDNDCSGLVDDAPACGCPSTELDGQIFYLCNLPMPWVEADAFCRAQGATLARIDDEAQSRALYQAARALNDDRWWIGLSDRANEGVFVWQDGTPFTFSHWSRKQPDNDGCNQDCAAIKEDSDGKWHDTHCGQHRPFICRASRP